MSKLQELSDLVDGLIDKRNIEAFDELQIALENVAEHADDENLQSVNDIVDKFSDPNTPERIEDTTIAVDHLTKRHDALQAFDAKLDAIFSRVNTLNEALDQISDRTNREEQRLKHIKEVLDNE